MAYLLLKTIMLIVLLLSLQSEGFSQLDKKDTDMLIPIVKSNRTLLEIKNTLEKLCRLRFIYNNDVNQHQVVEIPVGIHTYSSILNMISQQLNLSYSIDRSYITLVKQKQASVTIQYFRGKVYDENRIPLSGVLVREINSTIPAVITNSEGQFLYSNASGCNKLEVSMEGYESQTVSKLYDAPLFVQLQLSVTELQEAIVNVYAPVSKRNSTASVGPLSVRRLMNTTKGTETISDLLQGRIPGVLVTPVNGAPGNVSDIQIRGHQSIGLEAGSVPANHPLVLIDGVPLLSSNKTVNVLSSILGSPDHGSIHGGTSAMLGINQLDIDRIEVFKDADATAIFGNRGAHGVISIITRSGKFDTPARYSVTASRGIGVSTRIPSLMNTAEFAGFQHDIYRLSNRPADSVNAPWLHQWPLERNINWPKYMLGNISRLQQLHISASGGAGKQFIYYFGAGIQDETSTLPLKRANQKASLTLNSSLFPNSRSRTDFSFSLNYSHYQLPAVNPMDLIRLPPNAPYPLDKNKEPVFRENNLSYANPYAQQFNKYDNRLLMFHAALNSEYLIARNIQFKVRLGFNNIQADEQNEFPISAYHSESKMTASIESANSGLMGVMAESQIQYLDTGSRTERTFSIFLGATYQAQVEKMERLAKSGFASDYLMRFPEMATTTSRASHKDRYKYGGLYSGMNLTLKEKYLLNLTTRLDGTSRLGPEHNVGVFGALGAGLIFTKYPWVEKHLPFINFGKLRASIGTTGSDNIGDYRANNQLVNELLLYNGVRSIRPSRLANPELQWERNLKKEVAIEGKSGNWLSFIIAWYHNITSRQFISGSLPSQSGVSVLGMNHNAAVLNTGFEFGISTLWKKKGTSRRAWRMELALTIPRNRLQWFENLEASQYSQSLVVGQPLTVRKGLLFKEVDPATGLNEFYNVTGSPSIDHREDMVVIGDLDPKLHGGINNELSLGQWKLCIFIDGRKQMAINPELYELGRLLSAGAEGLPSNFPAYFNNRWRNPGDKAAYQKFTLVPDTEVSNSIMNRMRSNKMLIDGSFIRLRNVSLNWSVNPAWAERNHLNDLNLFIRAQNVLVVSGFTEGDPTILNTVEMPSLRTFEAGFQVSF